MNAQHKPDEHENVDYINQELGRAADDLIATRTILQLRDDGTITKHIRPSRYTELSSDEATKAAGTGTSNKSKPTAWIDALDWIRRVDTTVAEWVGDPTPGNTPDRLLALVSLDYRPQDIPKLESWTIQIERWITQADELLDPPKEHKFELVAACPACQVSTIYRPDSTGEMVRQAALQITGKGCVCQHCKTTWTPELYEHLGRVLGCKPIEGVIDGISTGTAGQIR